MHGTTGLFWLGSAPGMVCWFQEFLTDSYMGGGLRPCLQGLGLLPGSACPHYEDPQRRATYKNLVKARALSGGIGAEGCVALHYVDGVLAKVVTSNANRTGFSVQLGDNGIVEKPLEQTLLR